MCIAHLRCAFLIMSGGHHVNACFDQMLCLCDGAGDHDRQIPNQLLSLQRSPTPAVMSILPVGPPPCSRRAVSRRVGSSLSRKPRLVFVPVFRPARRDRAGAYHTHIVLRWINWLSLTRQPANNKRDMRDPPVYHASTLDHTHTTTTWRPDSMASARRRHISARLASSAFTAGAGHSAAARS